MPAQTTTHGRSRLEGDYPPCRAHLTGGQNRIETMMRADIYHRHARREEALEQA
jgi:hypothetical protein